MLCLLWSLSGWGGPQLFERGYQSQLRLPHQHHRASIAVLQPHAHALRGSHREARRRAAGGAGRGGGGTHASPAFPELFLTARPRKETEQFSRRSDWQLSVAPVLFCQIGLKRGFLSYRPQPSPTWSGHSLLLSAAIAFVSPAHSSKTSLSHPSLFPIKAERPRKR